MKENSVDADDATFRLRAMYARVRALARDESALWRHLKCDKDIVLRFKTNAEANGDDSVRREVETRLRRERDGAYVSMEDVALDGEDFDVDVVYGRDVWARGRVRRLGSREWTLRMVATPARGIGRSREAEKAVSRESESSFEVEIGLIGMSRKEQVCLVSQVELPMQRVTPSPRTPRGVAVVGETSAMLPAIDEHATERAESKAVARQHHKYSSWRSTSLLGGGDLESLAILSKMRQRYESIMDFPDEYPVEPMKLSWFEASLRLGIGVGLGAVLGVGLGVGVVVNGFRAIGSGRISPTMRSRKSSLENLDL